MLRRLPGLLATSGVVGYEEPLRQLVLQLTAYNGWLWRQFSANAGTDSHLAPEQCRFSLQRAGIDLSPDRLASMGRAAFSEYQLEMRDIARSIAKKRIAVR